MVANYLPVQATTDLKITVFWGVAPCSLVELYRRLRGGCCHHHPGAQFLVAATTSETSVNVYQATRCNNSEDNHLHMVWKLWYFSFKICRGTTYLIERKWSPFKWNALALYKTNWMHDVCDKLSVTRNMPHWLGGTPMTCQIKTN
jgi:hypothetical protein